MQLPTITLPTPVPGQSPWRKMLGEVVILLVAILVVLGCCRVRWNRKSFFHSQSEDVAEITEGHEDKEDKESDAGDWSVEQLLTDSLGLPDADPDPLLEMTGFDADCIPKYIDSHYSSWKLLLQIMLTLGQFWGALFYMYWSLLNGEEEMMDCEAFPKDAKHAFFVRHACHYTRACLHGFPVIAANMILILMIRTLVQQRLYYSMLRCGFLIVFQSIPILHTIWPLAIAMSMGQGALHFVLKAYYVPEGENLVMVLRLMRKFVLPGGIFFMILFRYADVENTLVPLNHIAELEVNEDQHHSPWLTKLKIMNERVLAFDVRHRDVFADVKAQLGRVPNMHDVFTNVITGYDLSKDRWHARVHRKWGLFRSMWPAALLLDPRLDRKDKATRQWITTGAVLLTGCVITSLLSVYLLIGHTDHLAWNLFFSGIKTLFTKGYITDSGHVLVNVIVLAHAFLIIVFVYQAVINMFYFSFTQAEIEHATNDKSKKPSPYTSKADDATSATAAGDGLDRQCPPSEAQ